MTDAARTQEFIFSKRVALLVWTFQTDVTSRSTENSPSRSNVLMFFNERMTKPFECLVFDKRMIKPFERADVLHEHEANNKLFGNMQSCYKKVTVTFVRNKAAINTRQRYNYNENLTIMGYSSFFKDAELSLCLTSLNT